MLSISSFTPSPMRAGAVRMARKLSRNAFAAGLGLAAVTAIGLAGQPVHAASAASVHAAAASSAASASGATVDTATAAAGGSHFKVLALYYASSGDPAHDAFAKEATPWFTKTGSANGWTFESTTDWTKLPTDTSEYQVLMFIDGAPGDPAGQKAFQKYMENGGGWMGFHVSAFTSNSADWSWYYNTFLGSGNFQTNTWGPTSNTLKVDLPNHPSMAGLPDTIKSCTSEWYSWEHKVRENPDIDVLASIDESGFPVGSDPNQQWQSGDYPVVWSNKKFKMVYANFGHNAMDYAANKQTSSTFDSEDIDKFLIQAIQWLGGASSAPSTLLAQNSSDTQSLLDRNTGIDVWATTTTANSSSVQPKDL